MARLLRRSTGLTRHPADALQVTSVLLRLAATRGTLAGRNRCRPEASGSADVRLPKPSELTIRTEPNQQPTMFWTRKNKEEHRYYLLPGMGRSNRRRHQQFLRWSIVVGLLASAAFAYLLYLLSQSH